MAATKAAPAVSGLMLDAPAAGAVLLPLFKLELPIPDALFTPLNSKTYIVASEAAERVAVTLVTALVRLAMYALTFEVPLPALQMFR
jgi:hypothetical protein